jgi:hypothetical protein
MPINPALQLWREVLNQNGVAGVLRKTDPRYPQIRAEYEDLIQQTAKPRPPIVGAGAGRSKPVAPAPPRRRVPRAAPIDWAEMDAEEIRKEEEELERLIRRRKAREQGRKSKSKATTPGAKRPELSTVDEVSEDEGRAIRMRRPRA